MKKTSYLLLTLGLIITVQSKAQTIADTTGIKETVMNYIEGFYTADADRMEKALHYDLAKRYVTPERNGRNYVQNMTAMMLYQVTKMQEDKSVENGKLKCDIKISEIYGNVAIVRAETDFFTFIDFIQLGKIDGEWKIVNVIWERKPVKEDS
jgi:hypothetical protein